MKRLKQIYKVLDSDFDQIRPVSKDHNRTNKNGLNMHTLETLKHKNKGLAEENHLIKKDKKFDNESIN